MNKKPRIGNENPILEVGKMDHEITAIYCIVDDILKALVFGSITDIMFLP